MKHLKLYEDIETEIQLGDYIVCKDELFEYPTKNNDKDFVDFISNNIGKVIKKGYKIFFRFLPQA